MKISETVVMSVLALGLSGGVVFAADPFGFPDDHFLCYKEKDVTSPKFAGASTMLADQFESGPFDVAKDKAICAPAAKNGVAIVDPDTHLVSYTIKATGAVTTTSDPRTGIKVVNQFHSITSPLFVDIGKGDRLLVPANKSLTADPAAPDLTAINVDHYHCYKAKVSKAVTQPKFAAITVDMPGIQTQFDTAPRKYLLKKVSRLCAPVAVGTGTIKDPRGHFLCYKAQLVKGEVAAATHHIFTHDEFAGLVMDTGKVAEFCVPSLKNPNPVCGNGMLEIGEQCDGNDGPCPGQCYSDIGICACPAMHTFNLGDSMHSTSTSNARGTLAYDSDLSVGPLEGSFTIATAAEVSPGSGVIPLAVLPTAFPPVLFLGQNVCAFLVDLNDGSMTAGSGVLNCPGAALTTPFPPTSDFRLFRDHCTQSSAGAPTGCDSGNLAGNCTVPELGPLPGTNHPGVDAGEPAVCVTTLPPDPTCSSTGPTGGKAVREVGHCSVTTTMACQSSTTCPSGEVCLGHCSTTTTTTCSTDAGCPVGETCDAPDQHDGACNSPNYFIPGKDSDAGTYSWAPQATFLQMNLVIKVQGATACSAHAGKCKIAATTDCDRNTDCVAPGDTCVTGANLQPFTTTKAVSAIMDWNALTHSGVCNTMTNMCTTGTSATGTCVTSTDGTCDLTGMICTKGGPCTMNSDCGTGKVCDTTAHLCSTGGAGACTMNSDCQVPHNANADCRLPDGKVQALPLAGVNFSCAQLLNSTTTGAKLVTSLTTLDQEALGNFNDLNVGITFAAK